MASTTFCSQDSTGPSQLHSSAKATYSPSPAHQQHRFATKVIKHGMTDDTGTSARCQVSAKGISTGIRGTTLPSIPADAIKDIHIPNHNGGFVAKGICLAVCRSLFMPVQAVANKLAECVPEYMPMAPFVGSPASSFLNSRLCTLSKHLGRCLQCNSRIQV